MGAEADGEKKIVDIADLMEPFGKYQLIQMTFVCLPALFITMVSINYVFVVGDVNYRCRVDQCEDSSSTSQLPQWWPDASIDRCSSPVLSAAPPCTNTSFTGELTECHSWIYENNNTALVELDLACQPWKTNLIGTIHSFGMLVSIIMTGWVSDTFGRKPTLIFCVVAGSIGSFKIFAKSYYVYVFIEFLEAIVTGGAFPAAMVILVETAGRKRRLLSGVIFACVVYLGECQFAIIAMFVPYWKTLVRVIYGPCALFIVYIFLLNESPRWQIVAGKVEKAKETMKKIAAMNKIRIDVEELDSLDEVTLKEKFSIGKHEVKESFKHIFRCREIVKRLLVIGVCRFTSSFVYYGMMINSVWLPGDKYFNFLLSTLMSFPGEVACLYVMNKFGRKIPLMVGYSACGLLCVISAFVPASYVLVKLSLVMLGKVIISACLTGAVIYSMELFPTSVRGTLLGLVSFCSRTGGMLAPLTPILNTVSVALPFTFFGCSAMIAGTLLLLIPDTKDLPLFDTINQVECHRKGLKVAATESAANDVPVPIIP